ncbi:DNA-binding response regulator [Chitinophaga lutea]|uniref:DNA-binding response regulator n=1 Tax=Chitinophaga lutea TaxID=2488634 RepID=A0A3N4PLK1_9BACT|nr:LytTR family DNA-binding domain-containing protein [Chitinophaga lutea]RPE08685.1 DNA-binding response regulator [Chitinophaga lutea]
MATPPIRCIVVDDEDKAAEYIAGLVGKTAFLELVGVSTDPLEALSWVQQGKAELAFLDLTMPELHGIDFIKMSGSKCRFIVTTGYESFALQGFELDVLDFIKKPVSYERFLKAAGKALNVLRATVPPPETDYIFIKGTGNRQLLQKVSHDDILYIQGNGHQTQVMLAKDTITTSTTLTELENALPASRFMRVHKSYIVSIAKIEVIQGNIIILHKTHIPVGQQYQEKFFKTVG